MIAYIAVLSTQMLLLGMNVAFDLTHDSATGFLVPKRQQYVLNVVQGGTLCQSSVSLQS